MRHASSRRRIALLVLAAVLLAAALACGSAGHELLPALLLALPLMFGRYPGEELLARLTRDRHRPVRPARSAPVPRAPRVLGRRPAPLATASASRAPPLAA